MSFLLNSARMTTTTTGQGTIDLIAASTGYATFTQAGAVTGRQYSYTIEDGDDVEHGRGTYTDAATDTLSRDTVLLALASGVASTTKLTLSGTAIVYIAALQEDFQDAMALGYMHSIVMGGM